MLKKTWARFFKKWDEEYMKVGAQLGWVVQVLKHFYILRKQASLGRDVQVPELSL
jgi:hypothetical protein